MNGPGSFAVLERIRRSSSRSETLVRRKGAGQSLGRTLGVDGGLSWIVVDEQLWLDDTENGHIDWWRRTR